MKTIGITEDNKMVVSGIGELYFKDGIPLSVIFDGLKERDVLPSWVHLYNELKGNGMSRERIFHLLNENIFESYGKEFRDCIISTLEKVV